MKKYVSYTALLGLCWALSVRACAQTFQDLHDFSCVWSDDTGWDCSREGFSPEGTLIQAKDGNFYGTTSSGGRWGCGTFFRISPQGAFTTLAHFDHTNGCSPQGALL